jgi:multiple sugar transport system substrate-binding protein
VRREWKQHHSWCFWCRGTSGEITGEVKVTFQQFGNSKVQANFLNGWAKKFTAAHPQATVKLQPIVASENDYYTKLQLSMRSPRTAPDMCYVRSGWWARRPSWMR